MPARACGGMPNVKMLIEDGEVKVLIDDEWAGVGYFQAMSMSFDPYRPGCAELNLNLILTDMQVASHFGAAPPPQLEEPVARITDTKRIEDAKRNS